MGIKEFLIVYRADSAEDFHQISKRIVKLDPNIQVVLCAGVIDTKKINPLF